MRIASRRARIAALLGLLALSFPQVVAQAQRYPNAIGVAAIGNHIRVRRSADSSVVIGRLRAAQNDSLLIAEDSTHWYVTVGRDEVTDLEVQHDEKTRDQASTVMALLGAAAGGGLWISHCLNDRAACAAEEQAAREQANCDSNYVSPGSLYVLGGLLAGGLLGYALAPAPHWDVVAFPMQTTGFDGQRHLGLNLGFRYSPGKRGRYAARSRRGAYAMAARRAATTLAGVYR